MKQWDSGEAIYVFSGLLPNMKMIDGKTEIYGSDNKDNECEIEVVGVNESRFLDTVLFYSGSEDDHISLIAQ